MEYKYIVRNSETLLPVTLVTHDPKIVEKSLRLRIKSALQNLRNPKFSSSEVTRLIQDLDHLNEKLRYIELDIYGEVQ